jgi:two-component system phosphate regulon sensor histidine kinase PhoR
MTAAALALLALAVAVVLAILLAGQIRQRKALRAWLEAPELHAIPDGSGAWSEVFSRLQALRKKERRQHVELGNALERFRLATEALPDGVILLNDVFHIEWLNAAACRHFALDPARDAGTQVSQLIRNTEFHALLTAFRAGRAAPPTLLRSVSNGTPRVFSVQLIGFADTGTLMLSTDVTERVLTEIVHRDFIANVSHELRTPLTVIGGFLEQFNTPEPPQGEAARHFHRMMGEQAERMNRLVADLLTLSRLENRDQPPRDDSVDVPALIEALHQEAIALSAGRHVIEIAVLAPDKLRGSTDELRSAFGNLLFNAVRYTPAGGRIILSWHAVAGAPTFSVADTGIGIQAEHIPRLTERFYRVDKGRSSATGGTGLGLAIVKHVLARHGGELEIQSVPGKGSTFSARLPRERLL